jgi:hypothetical protein
VSTFTRIETADRIDVECEDCKMGVNTSQTALGRAMADQFPIIHKCYKPRGKK